jgi:DNA-binding MarR family transcriptional regulator
MLSAGNRYNKLLSRVYHNVLRLEESKRKYSRTTTSFRGRNAMEFIYEAQEDGKGSRAQSEIADYLKISRPSCTTLINKLEHLGYVQRVRGKTDNREVDIYLTRKGRLVTAIQCMHRNGIIDSVLSEYSEENQDLIADAFSRLNELLEECADTLENGNERGEK